MIFVPGKDINIFDIAVIKLTNTSRDNSPKRQGAAFNMSNKFSISMDVSPLSSSNDFSGFNKITVTDEGIKQKVDGATVDNVCKKRM